MSKLHPTAKWGEVIKPKWKKAEDFTALKPTAKWGKDARQLLLRIDKTEYSDTQFQYTRAAEDLQHRTNNKNAENVLPSLRDQFAALINGNADIKIADDSASSPWWHA